ncbi:MAG: hypothetical protein ACK5RC_06105, partial [Curvibacter sp.]
VPYAARIVPRRTFARRQLLANHAEGIAAPAANGAPRSSRDKAYTMTAELLLMQHSCHWFCRSRAVATARVLARHQTHYAQVVESVSPQTRAAYLKLTGR